MRRAIMVRCGLRRRQEEQKHAQLYLTLFVFHIIRGRYKMDNTYKVINSHLTSLVALAMTLATGGTRS